MALSEKEYTELAKYAYKVALKYVQNVDNAMDIAQNAMLALISSPTTIEKPQPWVHTIVRREASAFLKKEKKETLLVQEKKINTPASAGGAEDSDEIFNADPYKIFRLLKKEDYEEYKKFKKCDFSLTKFAAKEKVSFDLAHKRKYKLKRNLIAAYSLDDGWIGTSQILNYAQYMLITNFFKILKSNVKGEENSDLKRYITTHAKADFERIFTDVVDCLEWSITFKQNKYSLLVVCLANTGTPCFNTLTIEFNALNFLRVTAAKQNEIILHLEESRMEELQKFKKKGIIDLPTDVALAIVKGTQTTR